DVGLIDPPDADMDEVNTVNVGRVAVLVPSVAVSAPVVAPDCTVKVAVNEPDDEVVTVEGVVVCVTPLSFIVIVDEARKPVPDTVTTVP
ncbi:MAG: hypothetical protein KGI27_15630, partial [Thaumarchaeota archaeon]|nr:hypothetical protein [Nitrososphaerota archaeon]